MAYLVGMPKAVLTRQPTESVIVHPRYQDGVDFALIGGQRTLLQQGVYSEISRISTVAGHGGVGFFAENGGFINVGYRRYVLPLYYWVAFRSLSAESGFFAGEVDSISNWIEKFTINSVNESYDAGYVSFVIRTYSGQVIIYKNTTILPINDGIEHHLIFGIDSNGNALLFFDGRLTDVTLVYPGVNDYISGIMDYPLDVLGMNVRGVHTLSYPKLHILGLARLTGMFWTPALLADVAQNPWQLFKPRVASFILIPSSGPVTYQLSSALTSVSTVSASALAVQRALLSACVSLSSTSSISLVSLIPLLSALVSASATATSAWQVLRDLQSALTSATTTSGSILAVQRALFSVLNSSSSASTTTANLVRALQTALSSASGTSTITLSIAGLIALLSAISSQSSTATATASVQRELLSSLSSSSSTASSITLNTTTLVALISAVVSGSLSASSALNIARSLSSAVDSVSTTADVVLPVVRSLVTAHTSQSSTSISALELINLIALASTVSSQSSTSTVTANLVRTLVSNLLSASSTAEVAVPVIRQIASALVSASLSDDIDLALAMVGQADLVSLIQSASLTTSQARLLVDLVAAIQTEMKLQMAGAAPSLQMAGSGPSIYLHRTE